MGADHDWGASLAGEVGQGLSLCFAWISQALPASGTWAVKGGPQVPSPRGTGPASPLRTGEQGRT